MKKKKKNIKIEDYSQNNLRNIIKQDMSVDYRFYENINSNDWQKLELKKEEELTYTGNINLLYDNDYQYKIVVKGDKSESSDIEELYKSLFMPTVPDVSWNYNDEGIYFSANDNVYNEGYQISDENKIKSIPLYAVFALSNGDVV